MPLCHSPRKYVSKWFPLQGIESQEKKKQVDQPQKEKKEETI